MILLNVQILHWYYSPVFNLPAKGQKLWHLTFGIWHCHTFSKPGSNRSNMAGFTGSASAQLAQHRVTFPRGSKLHILGMSRVTNCEVVWTLFKGGSNPLSNQKLSISPEGQSCTFYLVNCPVIPCVWSKVWFCKWDSDGFQICFGGLPFPWGSKFHILLQFAENSPPTRLTFRFAAHCPPPTAHYPRQTWAPAGWSSLCLLFACTGQLTNSHLDCISEAHYLTVGFSGNLVTIALSQTTGEKPFV